MQKWPTSKRKLAGFYSLIQIKKACHLLFCCKIESSHLIEGPACDVWGLDGLSFWTSLDCSGATGKEEPTLKDPSFGRAVLGTTEFPFCEIHWTVWTLCDE